MQPKALTRTLFFIKNNLFLIAFSILILLFPLFSYMKSIFNDYNYPPLNPNFRYILLSLISLLYITYFKVSTKYLNLKNFNKLSLVWFLTILTYCATIPPLFSIDLYEYVIRGRMVALYGLNPFIHTPEMVSQDPLYGIIFWKTITTAYGPFWIILSSTMVKLTGSIPLANILGLKLLLLITYLSTGLTLYALSLKLKIEKIAT